MVVVPPGSQNGAIVLLRNRLVTYGGINNLNPQNAVGRVASLTPDGAAAFTRASSQALIIPSNASLQNTGTGLTLAAWFNVTTQSAGFNQVIASKDDDATNAGSEYYMGFANSAHAASPLLFQIQSGAAGVNTDVALDLAFGVPPNGVWLFVVGWYDASGPTVNIQVNNGIVDTVAVVGSPNVTSTAFSIGSDIGVGSFFGGAIDSLGLFKRVLSQAERTSLLQSYPTMVGNGNNPGTLTGGVSYVSDVPGSLTNGNTVSLNFDGSSGYVIAGAGRALRAAGSAFSCWFKPASFPASGGAIGGQSTSSNTFIGLGATNTDIDVITDTGSIGHFTVPAMSAGTWYSLIVNRDTSGNTHVYLNGVESSSGGQALTGALTVDQVGRYFNGLSNAWYPGKVSDVRSFYEALSAGDITAISGGSNSQQITSQYWRFNEGTGTTAVDSYNLGPSEYAQLPTALRTESLATFVSWWDLGEPFGVRYDSR